MHKSARRECIKWRINSVVEYSCLLLSPSLSSVSLFSRIPSFFRFLNSRLTLHTSLHIHLFLVLPLPSPFFSPPTGTELYSASILESIDFSHACHPDQSCTPIPAKIVRYGVSARKLAYSPHLWQYRLCSTPEIFIGASADFRVKDCEQHDGRTIGLSEYGKSLRRRMCMS